MRVPADEDIPLREVFITTDVTTLAVVTALAGLGVTAARGTTTRASHCDVEKKVSFG